MATKRTVGDAARYCLRHEERRIEIPTGEFLIGRASDCHLRLDDGLVSRRHARLEANNDSLLVADSGSRNGVLVNQQRIQGSTPLAHGDILCIGLSSLEIVDALVLHLPENLSTMPPRRAPIPDGEGDADGPEPETLTAMLGILTDREREVLELITWGHTQREMAERLHVSVKTIETHRANVAEKLGCRSRAELVSYAVTAGVLRPKSR
jgi:DNA-binding CsgD family transcriptional regulator